MMYVKTGLVKTTILLSISISLFFILFSASGCWSAKKLAESYIENDSITIYSTNPLRPFKYGYPFSKKECEAYYSETITKYGIKNGDVVADIGAASGYIDGAFSVMTDSVSYYIQDIDTNFLNQNEFEKVTNYFSKIRNRPQTNTFHYVIGSEFETALPDSMFDIIMMRISFHEIYYKNEILADIFNKLKPGGKLIIDETFSNPYHYRRNEGCNIHAVQMWWVISLTRDAGFLLTKMDQPEFSDENIVTFEREIDLQQESSGGLNRSVVFDQKKRIVDRILFPLEQMYEKKECKNANFEEISSALIGNMDTIKTIYPSIENYIRTIGWDWFEKKQYKLSMNLFNVALKLYPKSADVYYDIGVTYAHQDKDSLALDAFNQSLAIDSNSYTFSAIGNMYYNAKDYSKALLFYKKAFEMDGFNEDARDQIIETKKKMIKYKIGIN